MPAPTVSTSTPRRYRRGYPIGLRLAQKPLFCCGCICLGPRDGRRLKRIARLTRAIVATWGEPRPFTPSESLAEKLGAEPAWRNEASGRGGGVTLADPVAAKARPARISDRPFGKRLRDRVSRFGDLSFAQRIRKAVSRRPVR